MLMFVDSVHGLSGKLYLNYHQSQQNLKAHAQFLPRVYFVNLLNLLKKT